jgi:outer membrane protein TolC
MKPIFLLTAVMWAAMCSAQPVIRPAPADLPSDQVAMDLLDKEPSVLQARAALDAARQRADVLTAGPHEWTANGTMQRRRDRTTGSNFNEWNVGLAKGIRIGGKAQIDRDLGEAHVRLAEARYGEARHEAARALLNTWMDWAAAERSRQLWREQVAFAQGNLNVATKRREAGDASALEQNAARVDFAEVQRQLSAATNEESKARALLRTRFTGLSLTLPALAEPDGLQGEPLQWRERIVQESDVLRAAREELRVAELQAARAKADRVADPTLGVFTSSERSGSERLVGLSISIPIGGQARVAQARESAYLVDAATAAVDVSQREVDAEIARNMTDVEGSLERWQLARQAMAASQDNARLTQRAYTLGEADLQTLLLARRQSVDAALAAEQAHIDVLKARYRLYIDAHLIWGLQGN